jgi:hypothetical protein
MVLAVSPLLGLFSDFLFPKGTDRPRLRAAVRLAVTLAPVVVVTIHAGIRFAAAADETGAYY